MGFLDGLLNGLTSGINNALNSNSDEKITSNEVVAGKALSQWDREWISIGKLVSADLSPYNRKVGLYKHVVNGKIMYIGRAIEYDNGGFRKRLSDYRRESDSARKHSSGQTINNNLNDIETYILVVGSTRDAAEKTKELEVKFIEHYHPEWNVQHN